MKKNTVMFRFAPKKITADKFTFIDLCAGIGGMRLAFENLGGKCVLSSEWNEFCQETYNENFGEIPYGDVTKIPIDKIPKHDILIAGFPCQPFSKGGASTRKKLNKKNGFADKTQGNIFFHIAKIIEKKKPKAILLENVSQLERMEGGKVLQTILNTLHKAGYTTNYKVISSETIVPQRRQRIYIVGFRSKVNFEFPKLPNLEPKLKNILESKVDQKYTLSDNLWTWLQKHAEKHAKKGNGYGYRLADRNKTTCTLSARYGKDGSEILLPQKGKNPRKLTPRECARLMGFPDDFKIPVSDWQAYKQFGNSVVIPVVYLMGYEILKGLDAKTNRTVVRSPLVQLFERT